MLSCADLRWPELFQIIAKMPGKKMTNEELDALSYNERCQMLSTNPVIVAKHPQYRVETFFNEVLLSKANPIGKIVYYALRYYRISDERFSPFTCINLDFGLSKLN